MKFAISEDFLSYSQSHTTPDSLETAEITKATYAEHPKAHMISGSVVARLIQTFLKTMQAKRVLEVGCFTGYSALSMAEALPDDGEVITLEINEENAQTARTHLEKSPHGHKVKVQVGEALPMLGKLEGPFDLAFIDADKLTYPQYLEAIYPIMREGGLIVLDNTWLEGKVLSPNSDSQRAMAQLNNDLSQDPRFDCVMLTVRDGLTVLYKK